MYMYIYVYACVWFKMMITNKNYKIIVFKNIANKIILKND